MVGAVGVPIITYFNVIVTSELPVETKIQECRKGGRSFNFLFYWECFDAWARVRGFAMEHSCCHET